MTPEEQQMIGEMAERIRANGIILERAVQEHDWGMFSIVITDIYVGSQSLLLSVSESSEVDRDLRLVSDAAGGIDKFTEENQERYRHMLREMGVRFCE